MRKNVRYTPLGRVRRVSVSFGLDHKKIEAEVVDESMNGFGLRLKEVSGVAVGQTVTIEGPHAKAQGTIMRLESMGNGTFQIGVQFSSPTKRLSDIFPK